MQLWRSLHNCIIQSQTDPSFHALQENMLLRWRAYYVNYRLELHGDVGKHVSKDVGKDVGKHVSTCFNYSHVSTILNFIAGCPVSARAMKLCIEEIEADPSSSNAHFLTCPGRSGASVKRKSVDGSTWSFHVSMGTGGLRTTWTATKSWLSFGLHPEEIDWMVDLC